MKDKSDRNQLQAKLTRREGLIALTAVVGSAVMGKLAEAAQPITGIYGPGSRSIIDRIASSSSSAFLADFGGDSYTVRVSSLASHPTGTFPNGANPTALGAVNMALQIPKSPVYSTPVPVNGYNFGVALNGVIFDTTGPWWKEAISSGWSFDNAAKHIAPHFGIDSYNGHTREGGLYHYHAKPLGLIAQLDVERKRRGEAVGMMLLGWAADGFPIYSDVGYERPSDTTGRLVTLRSSYRLKSGNRPAGGPPGAYDGTFHEDYEYVPGLGHLDECNGRFGKTAEFPGGTYYYVVTANYPYIPQLFRGKAHASFAGADLSLGISPPLPHTLKAIYG